MSEIVTLLGGPRDGERMSVRHGDQIRFAYVESLPMVSIDSEAACPRPRIEDRIYRRSARDPARFIFVPTRKDGIDTVERVA